MERMCVRRRETIFHIETTQYSSYQVYIRLTDTIYQRTKYLPRNIDEYYQSEFEARCVLPKFCVVFCGLTIACLSFNFVLSFGHCIACPSIYSLGLPLWYLQNLSCSFTLACQERDMNINMLQIKCDKNSGEFFSHFL